ncbi:hypothetical protein [Novosphingobium sp. Leaf2]|uniref:hypothetical protein n=1 Tax=Novosphingobium sp. Leaf2 TaxID=1735670 RepID=UPI0006F5C0C9|nr:hypothetical protein [Novosphingobium sp. Leaf2]KQM21590.1 hypothetical protein ASE49_14410 [Novosphingobium sp. Leaf2]
MKRRAVGAGLTALMLAATALAGPAHAERKRPVAPGTGTANPSALIATEIAFARMAREKGQWTAFAAFADDAAVMFEPEQVQAKAWLKRQKNPPVPVQWEAYQVWMSCDGAMGVTKGGWTQGASDGWFTTIWQRQKKGTYRWVLDHGETLATPPAAPDMLSAKVASCAGKPSLPDAAPTDPATQSGGASADRTLRWRASVTGPDHRRQVTAWLWNGLAYDAVVTDMVVPTP